MGDIATMIPMHRGDPHLADAYLVFEGGGCMVLPHRPTSRKFVHSWRLWVLNDQFSTHFRRPVFTEVTRGLVQEMAQSAALAADIAQRMGADLDELERQRGLGDAQ